MKIILEYLGIKEAGPVLTYGIAKGFSDNGHEVYAVLSDEIENKKMWTETFSKDRLYFIKTTPKKNDIIHSTYSFIIDCFSIKKYLEISNSIA